MTTVTALKLTRTQALAFLTFLGYPNAAKMDNVRLASKLATAKDVMPENPPTDEAIAALKIDVLAAIEAGSPFEVLPDEGSTVGTETGGTATAKTPEEIQAEKEAKAKADADAKAKKEADKKAKADAKAAKEAADKAAKELAKANKPKGVRPGYTNSYIAGLVLKQFGLGVGITDEMKAAYDELRGKKNPGEAEAALAWGWHVANAWSEFLPVSKPVKEGDATVAAAAEPAAAAAEEPAATTPEPATASVQ